MGMCVGMRVCSQVHAHGCVPVCMCVCIKESMTEMHSHGHKCVCVCLHRCLHMGVG